jgi:nucleoside-diphosphate-sugar epimerase
MSAPTLVLVTGANGFLGRRVVRALLQRGEVAVRCFTRPSSNTTALDDIVAACGGRCERLTGDLLSRDDCRRACEGVSIVLHTAAGFDKSFAGAFMNSALATRNLMEAFAAYGMPRRFVLVSSFAVYSNLRLRRGAWLDETCALEDLPQERFDAYGFGKLKQEQIVQQEGLRLGVPYVILRPGTIYGPGKRDLTGRIGVNTFGFFAHIGGRNQLPLTYVDNCADAVVSAAERSGIDGEIFNVVDDETLTSREFLGRYKRHAVRMFTVRVPYWMAYMFCALWEDYSKYSKGQLPPAFNRRRCAAEWKGNRFSNQKARSRLGWIPQVGVEEGMLRFLEQFRHE